MAPPEVPHHGAHNSFSKGFVERVRAENYIFCGDEHHNPEPTVVAGPAGVKGCPLSWPSVRSAGQLVACAAANISTS